MRELAFSLMTTDSPQLDQLRELLTTFKKQSGVEVQLRPMNWEQAWAEVVRVALYSQGPDISEIGNTWLRDLVEMRELRPLHAFEERRLGSREDFVPSAWDSSLVTGSPERWAFPWLVDTRLIYYRRDLLQEAGLDGESAFQSFAALEETLGALQAAHVDSPWVVPTTPTTMTLHNVAGWVWSAGGSFLTTDGKQVLFNRPEARKALSRYFGLGRYLAPPARYLDARQSDAFFWRGDAAVTISGPWLLAERMVDPAVADRVGVTIPPGIPFVGGSQLVIWQHTRHDRQAVQLLRFLTQEAFQASYSSMVGLLPARVSAIQKSQFPPQIKVDALQEGLMRGRSFRPLPLWGLVEERLVEGLATIWQDVLENPTTDLGTILDRQLNPLTQRLGLILNQGRT